MEEKIVQDQDTVIGDAMCEAAQLFYDSANQIAMCIAENAQCCIDNELLHKAELALAYMQGIDFGLAMDDAVQKWYLGEMEKSMASIKNSQSLAFQNQIYVPPRPSDLMGFDEFHCRGNSIFLHCLKQGTMPSKDYLKALKDDILKEDRLKYLFEKGLLDPHEFEGVYEKWPELAEVKAVEVPSKDSADPKEPKKTEDDSSSILALRNLFRQSKIDKSQYIGGLATLVATGLISKSEFTRLKSAAN